MRIIGESLLKGAKQALDYARGHQDESKSHHVHVIHPVDVRALRGRLNMSRKAFADAFGFSARTVEKWERGERVPEKPTQAYLTVIAKNPMVVREALRHS